ncbi:unnamed protein product, partial [Cuscuta europaea]
MKQSKWEDKTSFYPWFSEKNYSFGGFIIWLLQVGIHPLVFFNYILPDTNYCCNKILLQTTVAPWIIFVAFDPWTVNSGLGHISFIQIAIRNTVLPVTIHLREQVYKYHSPILCVNTGKEHSFESFNRTFITGF